MEIGWKFSQKLSHSLLFGLAVHAHYTILFSTQICTCDWVSHVKDGNFKQLHYCIKFGKQCFYVHGVEWRMYGQPSKCPIMIQQQKYIQIKFISIWIDWSQCLKTSRYHHNNFWRPVRRICVNMGLKGLSFHIIIITRASEKSWSLCLDLGYCNRICQNVWRQFIKQFKTTVTLYMAPLSWIKLYFCLSFMLQRKNTAQFLIWFYAKEE